MKPHAFLFLALGVLLAGCNDPVIPQCPSASVLSDTANLTVFRAGAPADPSGEAYTAAISNVTTQCKYVKAASSATASLSFTLRALRAPSPDAASYTVPYYLAVTQGDRILSKQNLSIRITFPPGSALTSQDVSMDDTEVQLETGHPPTDYQLLVGFQLSAADRAYNQTRTRFTP